MEKLRFCDGLLLAVDLTVEKKLTVSLNFYSVDGRGFVCILKCLS